MNVKLIHGSYTPQETVELLHQLIHVKIRFNEDKIGQSSSEEDIKMREERIKVLQHELAAVKQKLKSRIDRVDITSTIEIN